MATASENVRFDPVSGEPIRQYVIKYEERLDDAPRALYLPDCFKTIEVIESNQLTPEILVKIWRPTGCKHRYHFQFGNKLAEGDEVPSTGTPDSEGSALDEGDVTGSFISRSRLQ